MKYLFLLMNNMQLQSTTTSVFLFVEVGVGEAMAVSSVLFLSFFCYLAASSLPSQFQMDKRLLFKNAMSQRIWSTVDYLFSNGFFRFALSLLLAHDLLAKAFLRIISLTMEQPL